MPPTPAQLAEKKSAGGSPEFAVPVAGETSSRYGLRSDPLTGSLRFHAGVDIAAPAGTVVEVSGDGRVSFSGTLFGYGNVVIVEHTGGFSTLYGHHCENLVQTGEMVAEGQPIGRVGETGRTTGPHLHFEVRKDGLPLDPYLVI